MEKTWLKQYPAGVPAEIDRMRLGLETFHPFANNYISFIQQNIAAFYISNKMNMLIFF